MATRLNNRNRATNKMRGSLICSFWIKIEETDLIPACLLYILMDFLQIDGNHFSLYMITACGSCDIIERLCLTYPDAFDARTCDLLAVIQLYAF